MFRNGVNYKKYKNMISSLELFPTEILFEIFDYLTTFDIFYVFINLNKRINEIIGLYPFILDFQFISRSKFNFICRHIQPKQVISIYLSDEKMPNQVTLLKNYFPNFPDLFINLKTIKFINTSTILSHLPKSLSSLSFQTYLKTNQTDYLIRQTLNQQSQYLNYLKVDGSYAFRSITTSFPCLTHLIIDYCTVTQFHQILHYLNSSLTHLKLFIDKEEKFSMLNLESLSNSLTHLSLTFSEEIVMSFILLRECFEELIKLISLTIEATGTIDLMDGHFWEEYLSERKIKKFNFKFKLSTDIICHQDIDSLLHSFRSSFWIEKHRWYVACEKGQLKSSRPIIYSIPYFQSSFLFYPSNNCLLTSTTEKEILSKKSINLILSFCPTITIPTTPFIHVHSLTLLTSILPSIESLESIVNLKHIREVDVSSIKYLSIDEFNLFINSMINLNHIKMEFNPLFIPPFHIDCYTFIPKDEQIFINMKLFSHLFFYIKYLQITVQEKEIIIQLIKQLHYLEFANLFCYRGDLSNIKYIWFIQNIPRLITIHFTYRITSTCISIAIGDRKLTDDDDDTTADITNDKPVKCGCYKFRSQCVLQ